MDCDTEEEANNRYRRFIADTLATGIVWGLKQDGKWEYWEHRYNDIETGEAVFLFWSQRSLAEECKASVFTSDELVCVSLDDFVERVIPSLKNEYSHFWMGLNWIDTISGIEVTVPRLLTDLQRSQPLPPKYEELLRIKPPAEDV